MTARPVSNDARSKGPAGAMTATVSPGRTAWDLRKEGDIRNECHPNRPLTSSEPAKKRRTDRSVRQRLQITHQRRASAVELIETLGRLTERDDVLHRLLVQSAVRVACSQPLPSCGSEARR